MTKENETNAALFLADSIAQNQVLTQFILSCLFESKSFAEFRKKVSKGIEAVTLDIDSVTTDSKILNESKGYVINIDVMDFKNAIKTRDYVRNDDGKPTVFKTLEDAKKEAIAFDGKNPKIEEV